MSIALMTLAFKVSLPTTPKFVLIALCDSANDQGECYPSVSSLMAKCSLSDRGVQQALSKLEECGYLRREYRNGRSTTYWISASFPDTPERRSPPKTVHPRTTFTPNDVHHTPERRSPPPPNVVHPTPERGSPITIIEPSIEPPEKQKKRATPALVVPDVIPEGIPAEPWSDFVANRRAMRGVPFTDAAKKGVIRELGRLVAKGYDATELLQTAVTCGWRTVYEPKQSSGANRQQTGETAWQRSQRERVHEMTGGLVSAKPPGTKQTTLTEIFDVTARVLG